MVAVRVYSVNYHLGPQGPRRPTTHHNQSAVYDSKAGSDATTIRHTNTLLPDDLLQRDCDSSTQWLEDRWTKVMCCGGSLEIVVRSKNRPEKLLT